MLPASKRMRKEFETAKEMILEIEKNLKLEDFEKFYLSKDNLVRCKQISLQTPEENTCRDLFEAVFEEKSVLDTIYQLGVCYVTGKFIEKDNAKAFKFFSSIVELNLTEQHDIHGMAWYQLGLMYVAEAKKEKDKKIFEEKFAKIRECFERTIAFGYSTWLMNIAEIYLGFGKIADAMECCEQAHRIGDLYGTLMLGELYLRVHKDKLKGIKLLEDMVSVKEAAFYLMSEEDFEKHQGNDKYQNAYILVGTPEDPEEEFVENTDEESGLAILMQCHVFYNGKLVEFEDPAKLGKGLMLSSLIKDNVSCVHLTAEQVETLIITNSPNKEFILKAYAKLGEVYAKGIPDVLQQNYNEAEKYYKKARDYGCAEAAYNYFVIYLWMNFPERVNFQETLKLCQSELRGNIYGPGFFQISSQNKGETKKYDSEKIEELMIRFKKALELKSKDAMKQEVKAMEFFANLTQFAIDDNSEKIKVKP